MTLAQLRKDERVYAIDRIYGEDFKYEVSLKNGYVFDDGLQSSVEYADSIKEIKDLLDEVMMKEEV